MTKEILTQEWIKELVHYNPNTGVFTWIKKPSSRSNRIKVGEAAGFTSKVNGYTEIGIRNKTYKIHRLAFLYMTGLMPEHQVDHINHVKDDNRWCNLRLVTNAENQKNTTRNKNNTSGVLGVNWRKDRSKWRAQIMVDGINKELGSYVYFILACIARKQAEVEYGFHENHGK